MAFVFKRNYTKVIDDRRVKKQSRKWCGRITYSSCAMVSLRNQRFEILRCAQNDELCLE
jgi:hypothetical protein